MPELDSGPTERERKSEAPSIAENLHRVARFIMLQHPLDAEEMAVVVPEVAAAILAGNGAVKLIDKHGRSDFIVVTDGRRRTLAELPADFSGDVAEVRVEVTEPCLRPELDNLASRLLQLDPEFYDQAGVPGILDAVARYDNAESRDVADAVLLTNSIGSGLARDQWDYPENIHRWYEDSAESIGEAFLKMVLPGDVAAKARAGAWLLAGSADPALIIDVVAPGIRELTIDDSPGTQSIVPIVTPELIIDALNATSGAGNDIAWRISRGLQRYATEVLSQADKAEDFLEFHRFLHRAFLSFRTSQYILNAVLAAHNGDRYAVDMTDVTRLRDISEEKRAIIGSVLISSAVDRPFVPNITRLYRWEQWLASLRSQSLSAALDDVDDHYLRLIFPERIRKVAEACTRLDHAPANPQVLDRAMRTAESIRLIPTSRLSFPVQIASLGIRIARELRRMGSEEASREWWRTGGSQAVALDEALYTLEADPASIPFSQ